MRTSKRRADWARDERGFSLMQMIFVVAVAGILMGMAIVGFRSARAAMRLNNSVRDFASHVERARLDAIRRHDYTTVEFTSPTTYEITMDFANDGGRQTRRFTLDPNVVLTMEDGSAVPAGSYPELSFDWRGRATQCSTIFRLKNSRNEQATVQVAGSGDITVNNNIATLPNVNYVTVNQNADVVSTAVVSGSEPAPNLSPCNSSGASTTPTTVAAPTVTCNATTISLSEGTITVLRNGQSSQPVTATVNAAGTITVNPDSNLAVTPASQELTSTTGGSRSFTITSVTRTRSTFPVKFNFNGCSATLYVKVTN